MGVQLVNQAFEAAAAKGITICCASGDDGSSDQVRAAERTWIFPRPARMCLPLAARN